MDRVVGDYSGGMDSCLRRNDGKGWVGMMGGEWWAGVVDSSRGIGMERGWGVGVTRAG